MPVAKDNEDIPLLNKAEAAEFLNTSTKSIERYATKGLLHPVRKPVAGRKPLVLYRKDELLALLPEEKPQPRNKPATKQGAVITITIEFR